MVITDPNLVPEGTCGFVTGMHIRYVVRQEFILLLPCEAHFATWKHSRDSMSATGRKTRAKHPPH